MVDQASVLGAVEAHHIQRLEVVMVVEVVHACFSALEHATTAQEAA